MLTVKERGMKTMTQQRIERKVLKRKRKLEQINNITKKKETVHEIMRLAGIIEAKKLEGLDIENTLIAVAIAKDGYQGDEWHKRYKKIVKYQAQAIKRNLLGGGE